MDGAPDNLEINKWYYTTDFSNIQEYTGNAPISAEDYAVVYSPTYFQRIINSFNH